MNLGVIEPLRSSRTRRESRASRRRAQQRNERPSSLREGLVPPPPFPPSQVRALGVALGIDEKSVWRNPFPGPGLAIRVLGALSKERLDVLRQADAIMLEELHAAGVYNDIGQAFVVLLPVKSVGVMGDGRTYENVCAIRCVQTTDFMTADWYRAPRRRGRRRARAGRRGPPPPPRPPLRYRMDFELLAKISNRIINEVRGINRVTYDVSSSRRDDRVGERRGARWPTTTTTTERAARRRGYYHARVSETTCDSSGGARGRGRADFVFLGRPLDAPYSAAVEGQAQHAPASAVRATQRRRATPAAPPLSIEHASRCRIAFSPLCGRGPRRGRVAMRSVLGSICCT